MSAPTRDTHPDTGTKPVLRRVWVGALAGLLWLAAGGAAQAVTWFTDLGALLEPMLPRTMRGNVWVWPGAWGYAAALLGACAMAAIVTAILASQRRSVFPGRAAAGHAWPPWTPLDIVPGTSVAVSASTLDDGPQPD